MKTVLTFNLTLFLLQEKPKLACSSELPEHKSTLQSFFLQLHKVLQQLKIYATFAGTLLNSDNESRAAPTQ